MWTLGLPDRGTIQTLFFPLGCYIDSREFRHRFLGLPSTPCLWLFLRCLSAPGDTQNVHWGRGGMVCVGNLTLRPDLGSDASRPRWGRRGDSLFLEQVWGEHMSRWLAGVCLRPGQSYLLWLWVRNMRNYVLSLTAMRDLLYSLLKGGFRGQRRCHKHNLKIYHDRIFFSIKGTYFFMAVFLLEVLLQWSNLDGPKWKSMAAPVPICHWEQGMSNVNRKLGTWEWSSFLD